MTQFFLTALRSKAGGCFDHRDNCTEARAAVLWKLQWFEHKLGFRKPQKTCYICRSKCRIWFLWMINCIGSILIFDNIKLNNMKSKLKNKIISLKKAQWNKWEMGVICNDNRICIGAIPEQIDSVCVYRRDMNVEEADVLLQHSTSSWRLLGAKDLIMRPWNNFWADQGEWMTAFMPRDVFRQHYCSWRFPVIHSVYFLSNFLVFSLLFSLCDSSVNPLLSPSPSRARVVEVFQGGENKPFWFFSGLFFDSFLILWTSGA